MAHLIGWPFVGKGFFRKPEESDINHPIIEKCTEKGVYKVQGESIQTLIIFLVVIFSTSSTVQAHINDLYDETSQDHAYGEPPNQDGILGRYSVLAEDVVYLLPVGVLAIGAIYIMPEEVSNWDRDTISPEDAWDNWKENVTHWAWDKDDAWINYVGHPFFGSAYVVYARHYGYSRLESFWFSFAASFFYEVALEGWVEPVSIQDVIFTPVLGFLLAEFLLPLEQRIKNNNNELFNSKIIGNISLFLIDPLGYTIFPIKNWCKSYGWSNDATFQLSPIWKERSGFQAGSYGENTTDNASYGLFLTVHF